jgi:hypothetical protein
MPVIGEPPSIIETPIEFGRAFAVSSSLYTDLFLYTEHLAEPADNGLFASNFGYSWARILPGSQIPDEMILIDGDTLSIGGMEIFAGQKLDFAVIRRLGTELFISTNEGLWTADIG